MEEKKCRDCGVLMFIDSHKKITAKQLSGEFYYGKWWHCPKCHKIFFDNKWRVYNQPQEQVTIEPSKEAVEAHRNDLQEIYRLIENHDA
jgi:hypothetical protein